MQKHQRISWFIWQGWSHLLQDSLCCAENTFRCGCRCSLNSKNFTSYFRQFWKCTRWSHQNCIMWVSLATFEFTWNEYLQIFSWVFE